MRKIVSLFIVCAIIFSSLSLYGFAATSNCDGYSGGYKYTGSLRRESAVASSSMTYGNSSTFLRISGYAVGEKPNGDSYNASLDRTGYRSISRTQTPWQNYNFISASSNFYVNGTVVAYLTA